MSSPDSHSIRYLLRTVNVGIIATWIVLAALIAYLVWGDDSLVTDRGLYIAGMAAATAGVAVVSVLPWDRLLASGAGMWFLYAWSLLDITLITILLEATGGPISPLFLIYALTTVFYAASYPRSAQVWLSLYTVAAYVGPGLLLDWDLHPPRMIASFATLGALALITSFLAQELRRQNAGLESEIGRHEVTEARLRRSEALLLEAERVARLGSWEWDVEADRLRWSDGMREIHGVEPGFVPTSQGAFDLVHPDDRAFVEESVRRAHENGTPFAFEYRVVRHDSETRDMIATGTVETLGDGRGRRVVGTAQDVTERKKAEELQRQVTEYRNRQAQALEINDSIVQGLVVAKYALSLGDVDRTERAIERTLEHAKGIVGELLHKDGRPPGPGDLVRQRDAEG